MCCWHIRCSVLRKPGRLSFGAPGHSPPTSIERGGTGQRLYFYGSLPIPGEHAPQPPPLVRCRSRAGKAQHWRSEPQKWLAANDLGLTICGLAALGHSPCSDTRTAITHARARAHTHRHTQTHTRARAYTQTHTNTHTNTHACARRSGIVRRGERTMVSPHAPDVNTGEGAWQPGGILCGQNAGGLPWKTGAGTGCVQRVAPQRRNPYAVARC